MSELTSSVSKSEKVKNILLDIIETNVGDLLEWLKSKEALVKEKGTSELYKAFSITPRISGRAIVRLTERLEKQLKDINGGVLPVSWTLDEVIRLYLLLNFPFAESSVYKKVVNQLFQTGDIQEQVALYKGLYLLPNPELLLFRATEGVRSNMGVVFDAVALDNPYPSTFFDINAWNQLVLKAIFTEKPIKRIVGLDKMRNEALARMASDFAHERWAAKRQVTPELWRLIVPFINKTYINDFKRLIDCGTEKEKVAVVLACTESNNPEAKKLLTRVPDISYKVKAENLDWNNL